MGFDLLTLADGSKCLKIHSMDASAENALVTAEYDWVRPSDGVGTYRAFDRFASAIRKLHSPRVSDSTGLEAFQALEELVYVGIEHEPPFDYRRLPLLRSISSDRFENVPADFINHPALERIDIETPKRIRSLESLKEASRVCALRMVSCGLKNLSGVGSFGRLKELRIMFARALVDISHLREVGESLEVLELTNTPAISDVSVIRHLRRLRLLFVEAPKASMSGIDWITGMPNLECALLQCPVADIEWKAIAKHMRIYDIALSYDKSVSLPSDAAIEKLVSSEGKRVTEITRYPKGKHPAIRVQFAPSEQIQNPLPFYLRQNHLVY